MKVGHLLNERYKIVRKIGGGGMANVYLARDLILDRDVAVKALRTEYVHDEEFITRFDREAQAAASLAHPNIVSIYDVGEEEQLLYMVMEYVDGMTLKEYIKEYGPLKAEDALDIMKQIIAAISHAHAHDIVHRDIKPQNIMVDSHGQAKVTDFGIAMALSATSLTQTNAVLGSVHYLSPEQARGGMATKKSDIYSIGIVFYELLTGRLPFSGQSPVSIALKHLQSNTPSVRRFNQDIPQSVENIVLKATAKDPFHRYHTIYDLDEAVETALLPEKMNEPVFSPPVEEGDETKAIPVISDENIHEDMEQETLLHAKNEETKNYQEKETEKPKKKKSRKKWFIPLIILLLLLVGGAVYLWMMPGNVVIPDVAGAQAETAKEEMETLGLEVVEEEAFSSDIDAGFVISTEPQQGTEVEEASTVTLRVSKGKETTTFDDYEGDSYDQVEQILSDEGFPSIRRIDIHSNQPVGEIITQVQPEADSEVIPEETNVIFEVSIGPEPITVKDLHGATEDEAKAFTDENNLNLVTEWAYSETVGAGQVISQEPAAGEEVEEGTTMTVTLSAGVEEVAPSSHTITYVVPYAPDLQTEDDDEQDDQAGNMNEPSEEEEPVEQMVKIYIKDANHESLDEVYEELAITEDTPVSFTLAIPHEGEATYRIVRDEETLVENTIPYSE